MPKTGSDNRIFSQGKSFHAKPIVRSELTSMIRTDMSTDLQNDHVLVYVPRNVKRDAPLA